MSIFFPVFALVKENTSLTKLMILNLDYRKFSNMICFNLHSPMKSRITILVFLRPRLKKQFWLSNFFENETSYTL